MQNSAQGIKLALVTALISGVSIFINKFAVASLPDPVLLPAVKNFIVGLLFLSLMTGLGAWQKITQLTKKQTAQLMAVGVIGGFVPFYLFFTGLALIPASNANIIHKTLVIWVALLAIPLLKERLTKLQGLAIFGLFAGNLLPGGFTGLTFSKGELLVFCATLFWAAETILVKKLVANIDPKLVATARMSLGSLLLLGAVAVKNPSNFLTISTFTPTQWFWISLTALTLFGYIISWYHALKYAPAISVSAILVSATLVTNVLSGIFITRVWNSGLTCQGLVILAGAVIFSVTLVNRRTLTQHSRN